MIVFDLRFAVAQETRLVSGGRIWRIRASGIPGGLRPCALTGRPPGAQHQCMSKNSRVLREPFAHPVEAACTFALGVAGQLLLSRALAKAAERAERADLTPVS